MASTVAGGKPVRLSTQILNQSVHEPLEYSTYVDASNRFIANMDKISLVPKVKTLVLRDNLLKAANNLETCRELWNIDLANNRIDHLDGFERFIALGNVQLSGNSIGWPEVFKFKHMQIMNLSLFGNPIEEDGNYRKHVIDILPRVWSLDGQLITAAERQRVKAYFDSVETKSDLRRKRPRTSFVRSSLRNVELTGVFGSRTVQIMKRFPACVQHTLEVDRARVAYMAGCLEAELLHEAWFRGQLDEKVAVSDVRGSHLESILATAADQRNMLLLLLLSSLVFSIPSELMRATLEMTKLGTIHRVDTMKYFMVAPEIRVQVVTLLMSAAEIDRRTLIDGGLYPKLFRCLRNASQQLFRLIQGDGSGGRAHANQQPQSFSRRHTGPNLKRKPLPPTERFGNLLAVELSQLLCLVPAFIGYIGQVGDQGLIKLLEVSTKDDDVYARLMALMLSLEQEAAAATSGSGLVAAAPPVLPSAGVADAQPSESRNAEASTSKDGAGAAQPAVAGGARGTPSADASKSERVGETGIEATWEVYRRITSFLLERIEKDDNAQEDGGPTAPRGPSVFESGSRSVQPSRRTSARSRVVGTRHQARVRTAVGPRQSPSSYSRPDTASSGTYKGKRARAQTAPAARRAAAIAVGDVVRKSDGQFARVVGTPHSSVALLCLPQRGAATDGHQASPDIQTIPLTAFRRDASGQWMCDVAGAGGELSVSSVKPFSVGSSTSFVLASSSFVEKMNAVKLDRSVPWKEVKLDRSVPWKEVKDGQIMHVPQTPGWHQHPTLSPRHHHHHHHDRQDTHSHLDPGVAAVAADTSDAVADAATGNRSAIIDAQRIVLPDHLLTSGTRMDSHAARFRVKSARAPRSGSATIVIRTRETPDPHSVFSDDDGSLFGSDDEHEDDEILWVASRPGSATPGLISRRGSQTPAPDGYGAGHTSPPTASLGSIPSGRPDSAPRSRPSSASGRPLSASRSRPGSASRSRPGSASRSRPGSGRERPGSARSRPGSAPRNRPGSAPRSRPSSASQSHVQRRLSELGGREVSDNLINDLLRAETPTLPLQVSVRIDDGNNEEKVETSVNIDPGAAPIMMPVVEAEGANAIASKQQDHRVDGNGGAVIASAAGQPDDAAPVPRSSMTRATSITKIEFSQALARPNTPSVVYSGAAHRTSKPKHGKPSDQHHSQPAGGVGSRFHSEAALLSRSNMAQSPMFISTNELNFNVVNRSPGRKLNTSPGRTTSDRALKYETRMSSSPNKMQRSLSRSQTLRTFAHKQGQRQANFFVSPSATTALNVSL